MSERFQQHSRAWVNFCYLCFIVACLMMVGGVSILPLDIWSKGYLAMAGLMIVQTTVNLTKTLRDNHESERLLNRIEDAKTERILMDVNRAA